METTDHSFRRVLAVLEDLAGQEELLLQAEDYAALGSVQSRVAPLVDHLVANASIADGSLQQRVHAVIARRGRSAELLSQQLARVSEERREIQISRQRINRLAPIYGQRTGLNLFTSGQLCAKG